MSACFHCRHSIEKTDLTLHGRLYTCQKGHQLLKSESPYDVANCPDGAPQFGFQIGGYWSHMWFEKSSPHNTCLEWIICNNGDHPTSEPSTQIHICDFKQLENFVAFWGKYLREKGCIEND